MPHHIITEPKKDYDKRKGDEAEIIFKGIKYVFFIAIWGFSAWLIYLFVKEFSSSLNQFILFPLEEKVFFIFMIIIFLSPFIYFGYKNLKKK